MAKADVADDLRHKKSVWRVQVYRASAALSLMRSGFWRCMWARAVIFGSEISMASSANGGNFGGGVHFFETTTKMCLNSIETRQAQ